VTAGHRPAGSGSQGPEADGDRVHQCLCGCGDKPHDSERNGTQEHSAGERARLQQQVTDIAQQAEAAPTTSGGRVVGTEARTTVTDTNDNYPGDRHRDGNQHALDHRSAPVTC